MEWSKLWLHISKCKHLQSRSGSCYASYTLDDVAIESDDHMRNLSVIIDTKLKFHSQSNSCVLKANCVLSAIAKSFTHDMLP